MNLGILGGGQLGMMLCQAASKLGVNSHIYTDSDDSPAIQFSNSYVIKSYDDYREIDNFISGCDVITYEFENIPFESLEYINQKLKVHPSPKINFIIQDRLSEKKYVNQLGIPTVPFIEVNSSDEILELPNNYFPGILKTRRMGYDGKGQTVIDNPNQIININDDQYILEKKIDLKKEISVIGVRYIDGTLFTYQPIQNIHQNQILYKSSSPAQIDPKIYDQSIEWSKKIIQSLEYVGVICFEYFIDNNEKLYLNEIAPRVHNSGHLTIESYNISQFESHIRAVCNLNKIAPELINKSEMYNILGEEIEIYRNTSNSSPHEYFHDYFKKQAKAGRKMGHLTKIINS